MWSIPGKCISDKLISNGEYESILMLIILLDDKNNVYNLTYVEIIC